MFARRIAVIGTGYVGLTTGACLASLGHHVVCADIDEAKVARLRAGEVDILEPGLPELVAEGMAAGRLAFVLGATAAVTREAGAEIVFLCVPTPMGEGGAADLAAVQAVTDEVGALLAPGCVVVNKSTVPVGTAATTREMLGRTDVAVVSNPEFLREGSAVHDFLNPDRIVVGSDSQEAAERVAALYSRLGAPTQLTDAASAEMVKYAANCFLAMKLSYVNSLADLCERLGADVLEVTEGMGYDRRIGQTFLSPGPGWGGSCFPKDTNALLQIADAAGMDFELVRASLNVNAATRALVVDKVRAAVGGSLDGVRVGLLGLTFKAGTDDLRDSPALAVAALLRAEGAVLTGYDPAHAVGVPGVTDDVEVVDDPLAAAKGAAALVVLTDWPQFRTLDWNALGGVAAVSMVVDARNLLDADILRRAGFTWIGLGRG
ncbi:UDP-glucose/GDP-mannose dehydrogenase family protein [Pseudonocardia sp. KRD-184]|uniref:UDP-glucose 6-dehydrogenase n=1 Tax=Pseudonocardia oceani TaxID=2792013 RepID=A0ABS6U9Y9_9PSEU|nr:UDP-glucose/GDP-mannose dehydrogenase family protein [Pseudonocardia oceani]MBW0093970.1 UDP-glucose/GDP-mannose dehydrogenase family protein [Pseudonocardia oceani]MBW0098946.1 UDP-glucose/GDP-mannose dehydrogenase family protein [Pseudonocardia oceani]MBW0109401.1 UDP-glucose/GDP-mannose dehydrogenase family protein [Pseudonocardia oceani]MBW0123592.1 UDP-glucose/GDP-mannose dehydrogenase family protein [Pseudonocardia oceani]MBW0128788.1 UDP-glucose/GDP-mannose dehydrogenase family prote